MCQVGVGHPGEPATSYTHHKSCLLTSHEPTDFQRIGKLYKLGDLDDQTPKVLPASMLELFPPTSPANKTIQFLFLFLKNPLAKLMSSLAMKEADQGLTATKRTLSTLSCSLQ
jgi:hypothetical protein